MQKSEPSYSGSKPYIGHPHPNLLNARWPNITRGIQFHKVYRCENGQQVIPTNRLCLIPVCLIYSVP